MRASRPNRRACSTTTARVPTSDFALGVANDAGSACDCAGRFRRGAARHLASGLWRLERCNELGRLCPNTHGRCLCQQRRHGGGYPGGSDLLDTFIGRHRGERDGADEWRQSVGNGRRKRRRLGHGKLRAVRRDRPSRICPQRRQQRREQRHVQLERQRTSHGDPPKRRRVRDGSVLQSGGTNNCGGLGLGLNPGSSGAYSLGGCGLLTASGVSIVVGGSGTANFMQSGGTVSITGEDNALNIGNGTGGIGTYNLSGSGLLSTATQLDRDFSGE